MKLATFPGGIHPEYNKDISIREPLRVGAVPHTLVVPLSQHIGAPNQAVVKKGDIVEEGQVIGKSDSFVSSPVHSPVYGKVSDIKKAFHPVLGQTMSIFIEHDKEKEPKVYAPRDVMDMTAAEIIEKVHDAGLVGMGGAAFPTHVKLNVPQGKEIETLIINGAECEPYLTCDHALMTRCTEEILKGLKLLIKVINPKNVYIAIEINKKSAIFAFEKLIGKTSDPEISKIRIVPLGTKYPQGGEKQLIKAISGKEVPPGKLPLDIGFLIQNVGTVYAVYEAVYMDKPLIERIVTITGDCLYRPGNYLIKVGVTLKEILDNYGLELHRKPEKIIFGGPMMGIAQPDLEAPVIKSTSGILLLSEQKARSFEEGQCIKCAKCADVCPVRLVPTEIMKNVKKGFMDKAEGLCVLDCMECGSCAYICPARIPLVQYLKEGKAYVMKMKRGK
ncbi:MAG: electron transport complex subunit RsxC [Candidatus Omnitrophica bacterium]|nr:electron transport complex subunit RsxC [Candidatus Omnitrophota bacterium]MDD5488163.1 electron transport complex subunit RsxC [Candidatus Omnitrophota bacterium]